MRHRLANKSLSRPTAHRVLMLRNMVSSLLAHERISTTVAKAKEAQKLADKLISWGKRGGKSNWDRANSFLLNPTVTLRPLFSTYATRYASRPGGYTRVLLSGHRKGDHAPLAILELVDSPSSLAYDSAARAVGREIALSARGDVGHWERFRKSVEGGEESDVRERLGDAEGLEEWTRKNVVKALAFRPVSPSSTDFTSSSSSPPPPSEEGEAAEADETVTSTLSPSTEFLNLAHTYYLRTLAQSNLSLFPSPDPSRLVKQLSQRLNPSDRKGAPDPVKTVPIAGRRLKAGMRTEGWELPVEEHQKTGGPIGRAKWGRGRESRRAPPSTSSVDAL